MARLLSLSVAASLLVASSALAQQTDRPRTIIRSGPASGTFSYSRNDGDRLVLGLSTTSGGTRDTLGLLISSIAAGGPAEKAGLEEGNRLVAINGVALRLIASDAADPEMAGVLGRRLQRELEKAKPGESVTLSVYANGQTRDVKVTPVRADALSPAGMTRTRLDNRSTIGASIGGFASPRDTLGVFVVAVADDGPLAKGGIFEGSRIASINGVDLRVPAADLGDDFMTSSRIRRLTREIEKLEPGANAELRVYTNGQYRNVTVKTVKRSELKHDNSISIFQSGGSGAVFMPPMDLRFDDGRLRFEMEHLLDGSFRGRFEDAMRGADFDLRGFLNSWRDSSEVIERRKEPTIRERSGGSDGIMPVEEVLKELEQRLRDTQSPASRPFRAASALPGDRVMASPLGATEGTQPRSGGGVATYRSTKPEQGGVFVVEGIRMSPINASLASYLGRGSERGLLILEIGDGWTGVAAGDVILSIDGKAVVGGDGIQVSIRAGKDQCVELLRAGAPVKATLRRK